MTGLAHFTHQALPGGIATVEETLWLDTETPVGLYLKLRQGSTRTFLLESVEGGRSLGRYSFIGIDPVATVSLRGTSIAVEVHQADRKEFVRTVGTGRTPLDQLSELLEAFPSAGEEATPRFRGGWVGYFGYDSIVLTEKIPLREGPSTPDVPDVMLSLFADVVAVDNVLRSVQIITNVPVPSGGFSDAEVRSAYTAACDRIASLRARLTGTIPAGDESVAGSAPDGTDETAAGTFEQWVVQAKEYIAAGDIFQVVLSRRQELRSERAPFDVYRDLRRINPSPYMYFLTMDGLSVIGSSPEMLVRLEDGHILTRPIAGTRPRGADPEDERRLEEDLLADEKERAEHLMLVDLSRNDLGRICRPGSVRVSEFMAVEKFSHVMHICSTVSGDVAEGVRPLDALYACFPAGTLTGAPKIRAMEIISDAEPVRRGIYGGAIGYIDLSGNMDTCIAIRTIVHAGGRYWVQAGAGIVQDSVPQHEYRETVNKMAALVEAVSGGARTGRRS